MNRHFAAASLVVLATVTAVYPITAYAAANPDLRKKVVGMAGIMNVTNTEAFVTREEFARMLVQASSFGSSVGAAGNTSVFADVPKSNEYASHIRIAVENGWMSGYLGGLFKPQQGVTLLEAVTGLLALLKYENKDFAGDQTGSRMAKYHFLKLDDRVGREPAELLTRGDCINLYYNLLKTKPKDGSEIYGKLFGCELTADGEINPLTLADNGLKGPKLIKTTRSLSNYIPFKLDRANVFINGEASNTELLKATIGSSDYVLVYYHSGTKTIWTYTEEGAESGRGVIRGTLSNVYYTSVNVMTPSALQLNENDTQYQLKNSEMQFAFSMYGNVRIGDRVTLVYEKTVQSDGTEVYNVVDYIED